MDKQKFISFFFDFLGMDLDKLLEGLGVVENLKRKIIKKAVNDFDKYVLERHGDNPFYEGIAKFWKENQVLEELVRIRYSLDSKFKSYSEFKSYLSERNDGQSSINQLSNQLMDEFETFLSETICDLSTLSQSDAALHKKLHEDTRDEIASLSEQSSKQHQELLEAIKLVPTPDISDFDWYLEAVELDGSPVNCYELKSQNKDLVLKDVNFWFANMLEKKKLEDEINQALTWIGFIENNIKNIDNFSEMNMLQILGGKYVTLFQKSDYQNMKMCFEGLSFREHYLQSKAIFEDLFSDGTSDKWIVTNKAEIGDIKVGSKLSNRMMKGFKRFYTLDCIGGPAQLVNDFFYEGKSLLIIEGTFKGNKIYTVFEFRTSGQANTRNLIPSRAESLSYEDKEIIELIENSNKKGLTYNLDKTITYSNLTEMKQYFIESLD